MATPPKAPNLEPRQFPDAPRWLGKLLELLRAPLVALNAALSNGLTLRENHACVVRDGLVVTTPADNPTWGGEVGPAGPAGPAGEDGEDGTVVPPVVARYTRNSSLPQSVPPGPTFPPTTPIDFSTQVEDTDAAVTTGSTWKFTVPAGKGGTYLVSGYVGMQLVAATQYTVMLMAFVNGTYTADLCRDTATVTATNQVTAAAGSCVLKLNAGDMVDLRLYQYQPSSVAARNTHDCRVDIVRLDSGEGPTGPQGPPGDLSNGTPAPLALQTGFQDYSAVFASPLAAPARCMKTGREVQLAGVITNRTQPTSVNVNANIALLPVGSRPEYQEGFLCSAAYGTAAGAISAIGWLRVVVNPTGEVVFGNPSSTASSSLYVVHLSLANIRFIAPA